MIEDLYLAPDDTGRLVMHNQPHSPFALPRAGLHQSAENRLRASELILNIDQAEALFTRFEETAKHRRWLVVAAGIMHTHLHLVVGVTGDPDPDKILGDFKAYGTRTLKRIGPRRPDETWWTTGGSKRKLPNPESVEAAVNYVRHQPNPLLIWTRTEGMVFSARHQTWQREPPQ